MDEMDFTALRLRYRLAFGAYRDLVERCAELPEHEKPSVEELRRQQEALDAVQQARRDLIRAVGTGFPEAH